MRLFASCALLACSLALAQPSQPAVKEGEARFDHPDAQTLQITTGHRTKIEWDDFSIGRGEATHFIQPQANSVVINQVMGLHRSDILGMLQSNGRVYLVNPQGIFIGPDAFIQTAGFVAATLDKLTLDADGSPIHFQGDSRASITHLGHIETVGGRVMLVAAQVESLGTIEGNEIDVASGPQVWVKKDGQGAYLIPQVSLEEIQESSDPMEFVIKQEGMIRATACYEKMGKIYLIAKDRTEARGELKAEGGDVAILGNQVGVLDGAKIDVSGAEDAGRVLIGGDYQGKNHEILNAARTVVEEGVTIFANGGERGSGGRIILWGDELCAFQGKIEAQGGALEGDGGFVEVSSHLVGLAYGGHVDLKASHGKFGTLYLDPFSITVKPNGGVNTGMTALGFCPPEVTYVASGAGGGIVDNVLLGTELNSCNVALLTEAGTGGDVSILQAIPGWTQPTTLFIQADGNINWNWEPGTTANFTETSAGSISIHANHDINFVITPGQTNASLGFHTGTGAITVAAEGTITFDDGQTAGSNNVVGLMSEQGALQMSAANLQVTSTGPNTQGVFIGVDSLMFLNNYFGNTINNPMTFNIAGNLTLTSNVGIVQIGNRLDTASLVSISGPITFTNIGGIFTQQATQGVVRVGHHLINVAGTGPASLTNSNITFNNIGSNALIQESESFLIIGHTIVNPTFAVNADIEIRAVGGSFSMLDTTAAPAFAAIFIGHEANATGAPASTFTLSGNILIGNVTPIQQNFTLQTQYAFAFIGHSALRSDDTIRGDITVQAIGGSPSVLIQSGLGAVPATAGFAGIGHSAYLTSSHGTNITTIGPETINIVAQNGLRIFSPAGQLSYIGYNNAYASGPVQENINIPQLNITTGAGAPFNMIGGTSAAQGIAFIGARNTSGSIVCPISIQGGAVIQMTVPSGTGIAEIVNNLQGAGTTSNITINAQSILLNAGLGSCLISSGNNLQALATVGSISLASGSSIHAIGATNLTAGLNLSLASNSHIVVTSGNTDLVVDNLFPTAPLFGPGAFSLDGTSSISAGGTLKIYTSVRSQNTISGLLQGLAFVPGVLFSNTTQERWLVYFPYPKLGMPFTIFYKDGPPILPVPPTPINPNEPSVQFLNATEEYLQEMQSYDDFVVIHETFDLENDITGTSVKEKKLQLIRSRRDFHLYLGSP